MGTADIDPVVRAPDRVRLSPAGEDSSDPSGRVKALREVMPATTLPRLLLVEDDALAAELVVRLIASEAQLTVRSDLDGAREALRAGGVCDGLIVDVSLPDGSGFDLVAFVRASDALLPVLVLTAMDDRRVMELAAIHHVCYLPKPANVEALLAFVDRARAHRNVAHARLASIVARLAGAYGLTPREAEILLLATRGYSRVEIEARLDIEPSTTKTLVRRMLRKTRFFALGDLVGRVHRDLFDWDGRGRMSSRPPPAGAIVAPQGGQTRLRNRARSRG